MVEDIENILKNEKAGLESKKQQLSSKRADIDREDLEIRKQLKETEEKIKGLPEVIKQRHRDFVKKYDENLNTLRANLDEIGKAKDKAEVEAKVEKAKAFLEKVKAPKRHKKLDPNKLPHETVEPLKPARIEAKVDQITHKLLAKTLKDIYDATIDFLFPSAYAADISPAERAASLVETMETSLTPEILDFVNELGDIPIDIFVPVRDGFEYEPYAGSVKGAVQTLREKSGNEWDLASLLVASLRAKGIPARYVVGTIQMPIDQAMEWLGVEDPNMAATLLISNGRPTSLIMGGGKISAVETRHVWVQAFISFTVSRGITAGQGDKWVDIDPSYKPQKITQAKNLSVLPLFDQEGYLSAFRTVSPYEYYEVHLQAFMDVNAPGFKPNALMRETEIVPEISEVLIGQLPYTVQSIIGTYNEVPDSFRQKFTLKISDPDSGNVQLNYTAFLPQLIGKRLTLSYIPATTSDETVIKSFGNLYLTPAYLVYLKPVIKLDGVTVAEGASVRTGMMQSLIFLFDSTIDIGRVANTVIAGEYYAIGLNAQTSGQRTQILDRIAKINDLQETINFNDYTTLDDRLGEILYLSAMVYHQNYDTELCKISSLQKVVDIRKVSEMMYFLDVKVDTLYGVPIKITPSGITADMDRDIHLVIPVDGDVSRIKPYMQVVGNLSSYLEHAVSEGVYQTEAISAVKAIQLAHNQGIPVHNITSQNINMKLPLLQIGEQVKTDIVNAVNAGKEVIVSERNVILHDWSGVGYIIQDPARGNGAYMISRGLGGSTMVIAADLMEDVILVPVSILASQANRSTKRAMLCFPGEDNFMYTQDDTCYTVISFQDIDPAELALCGSKDPGCRNKYADSNWLYSKPLIDFQEHIWFANLSKNVTAWDWQSQDNARYMRAGHSILASIEYLMDMFYATKPNLRPVGSGYRTQTRTAKLIEEGAGASRNSHHMDGVAADTKLAYDSGAVVRKCDVLDAAYQMIKYYGEVLSEDKTTKKKDTVHMAVPGKLNKDKDKGFWRCR